jgi:hypothetical protein
MKSAWIEKKTRSWEVIYLLTTREDKLVVKFVGDKPQNDGQKKRQCPENEVVDLEHILDGLERIVEVILGYPQTDR